jgi:hypothetical protein
MGKTVHNFVKQPFTNSIGQVINPGDKVAYVARGYSTTFGTGIYHGTYIGDNDQIVLTRIKNIHTKKSVPSGRMLSYTYTALTYDVNGFTQRNPDGSYVKETKTHEYPEYVMVDCEPYGSTVLQRHIIIKIEG